MRFEKNTIFYLLFVFISSNLAAQNAFEIEGDYSANLSKLVLRESHSDFHEALYHSFAIRINYILKSKIYFTSGVVFNNQGTTTQVPVTTAGSPEGTGESFTLEWKATTLTIPLKIGYYFIDNKTIVLGTELGLLNSFLLKQELFFKEQKHESDLYNDFILSFNYAIDFGIKLNQKLKIKIRPSLSFQINENDNGFKLFSYGLDLGVCYKLK